MVVYAVHLIPNRNNNNKKNNDTQRNDDYVIQVFEEEIDLVLIQTSLLFLRKLCLKNTSQHKNMIYITKQEGLYQNKVSTSLVSTCNCNYSLGKLSHE